MTQYHLVTNSVTASQVHETDDAYVIEDVPFVRPMQLAGGYVPESSIRETIDQWHGVPVTLRHPRNAAGEPIAANRKPETHLGIVEEPHYDGEVARADVVVRKDRLEAVDGADAIREKLESEEPIDVSSQYAATDLPAGEYDGSMRENVEQITRPDSLAILPNQRGRCSIDDGCGIDPQLVANAEVHVPMTRNATHGEDMDAAAAPYDTGALVRWTFGGDPAFGRVAEVFDEPGQTVERTINGASVARKVTDDEAAYLLDVWRGADTGFGGQALKSGSELSEWSDPPDAAIQANAAAYELTNVAPEDVAEWADDEWDGDAAVAAMPNPSEDDDAADVLDQTHAAVPADADARDDKGNWKLPFREGPDAPVNTRALVAIDSALSGGRGGVEGLGDDTRTAIADWTEAMLDAAPDDLFGSLDDAEQSSNVLAAIGRQVTDALGLSAASPAQTSNSQETTPAEPGVDAAGSDIPSAEDESIPSSVDPDPDSTPGSNMKRDTLIDEITSNSKIERASLEGMGDQCLQATHEHVVSNDDDGTAATDDGGNYVTEAELDDKLDGLADDVAERVSANQADATKDDLAREIVANSNEYDETETVREDYPTEAALETKRDQVTDTQTMPTAGNGLAANLGDDGADIDVSAGVLTDE